MRTTNPCGKSRPVDNPYEVWENQHGWTWHVLKKNQLEKNETPSSIWFCAVKSPYTFGSWEYGDCYKQDVVDNAVRTDTGQSLHVMTDDEVERAVNDILGEEI